MRVAGRSREYVLGVWAIVVAASTIASIVGAVAFEGVSDVFLATITALAAGGVRDARRNHDPRSLPPQQAVHRRGDRIRIHGRSAPWIRGQLRRLDTGNTRRLGSASGDTEPSGLSADQ